MSIKGMDRCLDCKPVEKRRFKDCMTSRTACFFGTIINTIFFSYLTFYTFVEPLMMYINTGNIAENSNTRSPMFFLVFGACFALLFIVEIILVFKYVFIGSYIYHMKDRKGNIHYHGQAPTHDKKKKVFRWSPHIDTTGEGLVVTIDNSQYECDWYIRLRNSGVFRRNKLFYVCNDTNGDFQINGSRISINGYDIENGSLHIEHDRSGLASVPITLFEYYMNKRQFENQVKIEKSKDEELEMLRGLLEKTHSDLTMARMKIAESRFLIQEVIMEAIRILLTRGKPNESPVGQAARENLTRFLARHEHREVIDQMIVECEKDCLEVYDFVPKFTWQTYLGCVNGDEYYEISKDKIKTAFDEFKTNLQTERGILDDWASIPKEGKVLIGKVSMIGDFGVFVKFTNDKEGFMHQSEIPGCHDRGDNKLSEKFKVGQEVMVLIKGTDHNGLVLSMRNIDKEAVAGKKLWCQTDDRFVLLKVNHPH